MTFVGKEMELKFIFDWNKPDSEGQIMCIWLLMYLCGGHEPIKDIIREKKQ